MKPLCLAPWTSIDIDPSALIRPCCKYVPTNPERMYVTENTIQDYKNSKFLQDIKHTMLQNEWPTGCIRCKTEEDSGIKSKRELDYARWTKDWDQYTEDKGIIVVSIAFGNTCNLKCISCNSSASSRWRKEYKDLYNVDHKAIEVIDNLASEEIFQTLQNVIHFDIHGGEPFLSEIEKQIDLLERYVESGQSKDISLHYTTNGQTFPNNKFWDLWKNFKEIDLQLSIDGVGTRYEYIRYPANNDKLLKNVESYLKKQNILCNFRLSVSHTLSAYNIFYLDEFFYWCEKIGLPVPWCGAVHKPIHMQPCVFPSKIREKISDTLSKSKYNEVIQWKNYMLANDSSDNYNYFLQMKDKHDIYRNLNFAKTFPELEELINGI